MKFLSNYQIAELLNKLADIYEAEGKDYFRIRAYRRASKSIKKLPYEISKKFKSEDELTQIPKVGPHIAWQIKNILQTGKLKYKIFSKKMVDKPFYSELSTIPGLGPKRIQRLHEFNITTIKQLKLAIAQEKLLKLPRFGNKLIEKIKEGISCPRKYEKFFRLFQAEIVIKPFLKQLESISEMSAVQCASNYRRKKEVVGNIDIIIMIDRINNIHEKIRNIQNKIIMLPAVREVIKINAKSLYLIINSGLRINIHLAFFENFGGYLLYYTGHKKHFKKLQKLALSNNVGLLREGIYQNNILYGASEQEIYNKLDLAFIEPELREDKGEIEASQINQLPSLIELKDIKGDLHCHTNETDGTEELETMVQAAIKKGHEYIAITDHSKRLTIAHGLNKTRLIEQIKRIDKLNAKLKNFYILKSIEVDILENGSLDLPNYLLKELDLCVCAIHSQFGLSKKTQTERIIRAMDNPYFNILAHPTGRLILSRTSYEIDIEKIFRTAKEQGYFMELNAQPFRLDLNDNYCRIAKEIGVKIVISTDAHSIGNLNYLQLGINQARRGWLEPKDVINTRCLKDLKLLLKR